MRVSGVRVCTCQKRDSAISVQILYMEENAIGMQGVAKMQTSKHGGLMMECLALLWLWPGGLAIGRPETVKHDSTPLVPYVF